MTTSHEALIAELKSLQSHDLPTHGGRTLAYVYDSGLPAADAAGQQALNMFASSNGLDPTAFPSLLAMEKDLIRFACRLVGAPDAVGSFTSGGTESILLAVKTARDAHPEIHEPVMIVPSSIHAAFHKAAHYFSVTPVVVDVDPRNRRADVQRTADAIAEFADRVILLAASAPSYAHGVIDPITELGSLATEHNLRFHVDACIGGWVLPFIESVVPWDFSVPGVTSISVDLHKYGYTPKGASLLVHRSAALRKAQFFAFADWPGYTMLNSTVQSTKSGGPLAAAWAVVKTIGHDGYANLAQTAFAATQELAAAIGQLPHLTLAAPPDSTLLAVEVDADLDVFTLADAMNERGWFVQPQMQFRELKPSLHLTVSAATAPLIGQFSSDLADSVAAAAQAGPVPIPAEIAEAVHTIDPTELDEGSFDALLALAGLDTSGELGLPSQMAPINALLNIAPPRLREALLIAFLDRLTR